MPRGSTQLSGAPGVSLGTRETKPDENRPPEPKFSGTLVGTDCWDLVSKECAEECCH